MLSIVKISRSHRETTHSGLNRSTTGRTFFLKKSVQAEITVHTIRLCPFLALEFVRHTLPFLVLNLTRCNPPALCFIVRARPHCTRTRWKMERDRSIARKIYRVIRLNAYRVAVCIARSLYRSFPYSARLRRFSITCNDDTIRR